MFEHIGIGMVFLGSLIAVIGALLHGISSSRETKRIINKADTLIVKSEEAIQKSEEAIDRMTGGDSWCFISPSIVQGKNKKGENKSHLLLQLIHNGYYPIPEIRLKIMIANKIDNINKRYGYEGYFFEDNITWLGMDFNGMAGKMIPSIDISNESEMRLSVSIGATNASIDQTIVLRRDKNKIWFLAFEVMKYELDKGKTSSLDIGQKSGTPIKLHEMIQVGFPNEENLDFWK
ncbi:MAG: hypothetical protein RIC06_09725 [Cyclobacteriaceae bacterium]